MTITRPRASYLALAIAVLFAACGGESESGSGTMRPGENCLGCHGEFTLAGTVYAADTLQGVGGVSVTVTDGGGAHNYTSNSVGNFYTTDALSFPVRIDVTRGAGTSSMNSADNGACNGCHGASKRITVP